MSRIYLYKSKDAKSHKELGQKMQELPEGDYVVEIKKNRAIRSLNANKYYHAILNIIAIDTGHTHSELHEAMKLKFNCSVIFFPKGGSQVVGNSTSNLDTQEFSGFVNRVKQWAMDEFGITIPEAKDITYQRWMEIETTYEENFNG